MNTNFSYTTKNCESFVFGGLWSRGAYNLGSRQGFEMVKNVLIQAAALLEVIQRRGYEEMICFFFVFRIISS